MQIFAIIKFSDKTRTDVESAYLNKFFAVGLDESKALNDRVQDSLRGKKCIKPLTIKGFSSYQVLSYHNQGPRAYLEGGCLIIGDKAFGSILPEQQTNLLRNVLSDGRDLQSIIKDPEHYVNQYEIILSKDMDSFSFSGSHSARLFKKPEDLHQQAESKYQATGGLFSCLFKACI